LHWDSEQAVKSDKLHEREQWVMQQIKALKKREDKVNEKGQQINLKVLEVQRKALEIKKKEFEW